MAAELRERSRTIEQRRNSWGGPFWWTRLLTLLAFVFSGVLIAVAFLRGSEGAIEAAIGFGKWVIVVSVGAYVARAGLTDNLQKFVDYVRKVT